MALHGQGKKLCRLIAGGVKSICTMRFLVTNTFIATLHILALISFAGLKTKIRDMTVLELSEVSWLFRNPNCETQLVLS